MKQVWLLWKLKRKLRERIRPSNVWQIPLKKYLKHPSRVSSLLDKKKQNEENKVTIEMEQNEKKHN